MNHDSSPYTRPPKKRFSIYSIVPLLIALAISVTIIVLFPPSFTSFSSIPLVSRFFSSASTSVPHATSFPVIAMQAKKQLIKETIEALGTAEANESVVLTSNVTETVTAIHFQEGQMVDKDTVLVELLADAEKAALEEAEKQFERVENLTQTQAATLTRRDEMLLKLKVAQANLNNRIIKAPFSGILGLRKVSEGALVTPGTPITTVDDINGIKLLFTVPERFLSEIVLNQKIEASSIAYPEKTFQATVYAWDTRIDPDTRAFNVKAHIPNPEFLLRPGMLLHVNIVTKESEGILLLEEAIQEKKEEKFVFVIKDAKPSDNAAKTQPKMIEKRSVTLGRRFIGSVEVLSGIQDGELVVTEGSAKLFPGASVSIVGTKTLEESAKEFQRLKE